MRAVRGTESHIPLQSFLKQSIQGFYIDPAVLPDLDLEYVVFVWSMQFSMCFAYDWQGYVVTYGMWFSFGPCNFQCVLHGIGRTML